MIAFHGSSEIKNKYLERVKEHQRLDEIVKGVYFRDGKPGERRMCGVGCTVHSGDHTAYERELGIPQWIARLEDTIFENLPDERAKRWPYEILDAINVGADLQKIRIPFIVFLMEQNLASLDKVQFDSIRFSFQLLQSR